MKKEKTKQDKAATKKSEENSPAEKVRDLVVCLGVAVLMALLIKAYLIEIFVIPSGSMEPTLHGRPDGGDRVLCTKVNYLWRDPKRWEIFVFLFPYEKATEYGLGADESIATYKGQNFIKRCVGLPGEEVAIVRGDIYVRSKENPHWERQVKSDRVQRPLWIPVYEEDFSELVHNGKGQKEDFKVFWRPRGELDWSITPEKTLRLSSKTAGHLSYRSRGRSHDNPRRYFEWEGIVDRYVVRQPVTFQSPDNIHTFRRTVTNQKIAARCPWTGRYVTEEAVKHYARRSDIPVLAMAYRDAEDRGYRQGEGNIRSDDYFNVVDLRFRCRARFETGASLAIELQDDQQQREAVVRCLDGAKGEALFHENGKPDPTGQVATMDLAAGKWHDLEFYNVDGEVRLFVNHEEKPLLTWLHTPLGQVPATLGQVDRSARAMPRKSGVMLSVRKGTVELDSIAIDRDIHYYSGAEEIFRLHTRQDRVHPAMTKNGHFIVGEDEYMALGDNCPSSNDSRTWGAVPRENRRGPAILVWWPLHRIHPIVIP